MASNSEDALTEEQLLLRLNQIRQLRMIEQLLQQEREEQKRQERIKYKIKVIHDFITVCYDDLLDDLKWRCQQVLSMVDDYHKECQLRKSNGEEVDEEELEKICSEDVAQGLKDIQNALPDKGALGLDPPAPSARGTEDIPDPNPDKPQEIAIKEKELAADQDKEVVVVAQK